MQTPPWSTKINLNTELTVNKKKKKTILLQIFSKTNSMNSKIIFQVKTFIMLLRKRTRSKNSNYNRLTKITDKFKKKYSIYTAKAIAIITARKHIKNDLHQPKLQYID